MSHSCSNVFIIIGDKRRQIYKLWGKWSDIDKMSKGQIVLTSKLENMGNLVF